MFVKFLNVMLPSCWQLPSDERRRNYFKQHQILWNSANLISVFRVVMFLIVLALPNFSQDQVIIWYVGLTFSDKIDGWIAQLVANDQGIGRLIDPLCDKIFHFIGLQYLLFSGLLDPAILGWLAMIFEGLTFFVALICVHFVWIRKNKSLAYAYNLIKQRISVEGFVNSFGKIKMVAYFLGITFLLLYLYLPRFWQIVPRESAVLKNLYVSFFSFGIFLAAIAFILYVLEAQRRCREIIEKDL